MDGNDCDGESVTRKGRIITNNISRRKGNNLLRSTILYERRKRQRVKTMETANIIFSKQTLTYKTSMIRDILKAGVNKKDLISFAGGLPDSSILPIESLQRAMEKAIQLDYAKSLQYGESLGYSELREWIADSYFGYFQETTNLSEIMITHGSQQALSLIGNIFLNQDSYVIVESPTYLGALQTFRICTSNIVPIACDENGMLEKNLIQQLEELKSRSVIGNQQILFYSNPVHQNPSTTTWSEERMRAIAHVLDKYRVISIEDEAYRLLSFEDKRRRSITSYRQIKEFGIQLGSFSKILSPGFRLGWIKANKTILEQLEKLKQAVDLNTNQISQVAVFHFFQMEKNFSYLKQIRQQYERKSKLFLEYANHFLPDFELPQISGGMFYWAKTPFNDSYVFTQAALKLGVAVVPGQEFVPNQLPSSIIRMNFTAAGELDMEKGFQKMRQATDQMNWSMHLR